MTTVTIFGSIAGGIAFLSSFIIITGVYLHKKFKRESIWQTSANTESITRSAPISRQLSSSCLANQEKLPQSLLSRSASFSEDLSARLQILTSGTYYRSYSPAPIGASMRSTRASLGASIRFPIASSSSSPMPAKTAIPSITFQLRYEHTIETFFITIFQLYNYFPIKNTQNVFLIVYLLPDDNEQRQTRSSTNGIFNEHFHFPLKANDLLQRILRLTVYTVDSTTRIRNILGHVFLKMDKFIDQNIIDKSFSTSTLSKSLTHDLQIRSDHIGELVLTSCYLKDQNLLQIRIHQINHFHITPMKVRTSLKAHLSGQTSSSCHKHHWTNTPSFIIPPSEMSFRIDQELNLSVCSKSEDHIDCHLRLHLNGSNQIHSHARWQQSLRSSSTTTQTIPLVAL